MLDCPVCGKPVDPATAPTSVYQGATYFLRCAGCKQRFDADPERFLRSGPDHGRGCGHHQYDPAPVRSEVPASRRNSPT
jgi:P-type Cu+ transporter